MNGSAVMLAVLPASSAATVDPGLSPDWTGSGLRMSAAATEAALAQALQTAAGHRCPLVIDCPDRDAAAVLIGVLAQLATAGGLAVGVVVHTGPHGCQLRAVLPRLSDRRWWPFWAIRSPGGAS
ncbi:hypothetical protein [Geodermatophilus sp. DSM 44513]|uniref:hypothetical protein n=1 Tax=Geodermatophilus sp. DSM 44513 TaxID=1528104 RepID=UPI0014129663|nr:hypothetical protein [Geodermatophilus sp. DSM 44513]WNV75265.1 hypothetical protein RTG05_20120 [Geodermatophilus sp. DSM 44513]